jgi:hypothetical protein
MGIAAEGQCLCGEHVQKLVGTKQIFIKHISNGKLYLFCDEFTKFL